MTALQPATGLRRWLSHLALAAMHVAPGPWRRRWGWWRWDEVLDGSDYGDRLYVGGPDRGPVWRLWRRGIRPSPQLKPWPREFDDFHTTWNWDNRWDRVPEEEMAAWAAVWAAHPQGQPCLDTALVGNAQAGRVGCVRKLLAAGADALSRQADRNPLMRQLWGSDMPFETQLETWGVLVENGPVPSWKTWAKNDPRVRRLTAEELESWRASGLPMPRGEAALLHALEWVDDPPVSSGSAWASERGDATKAIAAVRWWKTHGQLPPSASTRLLQTWLSTARMGDGEHYQAAVLAWEIELLKDGLPPRPRRGPAWRAQHPHDFPADGPMPWSHWMLSGPFFENVPETFRDRLCAEPDAWDAINQHGQTALDLLKERCDATSGQSRDVGLQKLRAWGLVKLAKLRAAELDHRLPAAEPPAARGRLRL